MRAIRSAARVVAIGAAVALTLTSCATPQPGAAVSPNNPAASSSSSSPRESAALSTLTPGATEYPSPQPTAGSGREDIVVITLEMRDDKVEASAIVPGLVESGGVCTLTLTREENTVAASTDATEGRESVYCGLLTVDRADLTAGLWTAVVSYASATRSAESAPSPINVS